MIRSILKIILLPLLFGFISGIYNKSVGCIPSGNENNYEVIFGDSYHNYLPGSTMRIKIVFKNNTSDVVKVSQEVNVNDSMQVKIWDTMINLELAPNQRISIPLLVPIPKITGTFKLSLTDSSGIISNRLIPSFEFDVIQPKKSPRLSKILVHTPDAELALNTFLKSWEIKAPTVSWGQVLLLGKKSWQQYVINDKEITQLIDRSLKREMSVIFLDFGPAGNGSDQNKKFVLPYDVSVSFITAKEPEQSFTLKSDYKELVFDFLTPVMNSWNGSYGITVPATDLKFEGKGVVINAFATTGENPYRFPIVEIIPKNGKGKLYLCQIATYGRLDETVSPSRNQADLPAYDPIAVQFLLNLISAAVGDNLLK